MVPFHISIVKNVSKTDEEFLRINFISPTDGDAKDPNVQNPKAIRIKEVSYRFPNAKDLNSSLRLIKELRKRVTEKEMEGRARASLIEQEKLILSKGRNPRLVDVFVRPNPVGRRTNGALEAHTNGFRFSLTKGDVIGTLKKKYC
jgi:nucleosome binding factor SPN SPT16 subunit